MKTWSNFKRIRLVLRLATQSSRLLLTLLACVLFSSVLAFRRAPFSVSLVQALPRGADLWADWKPYLLKTAQSMRQVKIDLYQAQYALETRDQLSTDASHTSDHQTSEPPTVAQSQPPQTAAILQPPTPPLAVLPPERPTVANPALTIDAALEMRVAIAADRASLSIGASTPTRIFDANGSVYEIPAQTTYRVQPNQQGIGFGDWRLAHAIWIEPSQGGHIYVGDRGYRGRLLLSKKGDSLLAVNYVLLRDYLFSVVGSEMYLDWPIESLRAQAVAARSYALTHHVRPASSDYDLDNTQRFQAYKGVAREANTTHVAVQSTSGEFISYQGGIVESLYAASDQIVIEAHGGQGMSQRGAMELAKQGYNYQQILGTYYPGTGLARLEVQQ